MAAAGTMSHTTAPGLDFGSRMTRSGFGQKASENIGRGQEFWWRDQAAWMNSTNHRNNMLNPNYSRLRICVRNRSFRQAVLGQWGPAL